MTENSDLIKMGQEMIQTIETLNTRIVRLEHKVSKNEADGVIERDPFGTGRFEGQPKQEFLREITSEGRLDHPMIPELGLEYLLCHWCNNGHFVVTKTNCICDHCGTVHGR